MDLAGGGQLGTEGRAQDVFDTRGGDLPRLFIDLRQRRRSAGVEERCDLLRIFEVESFKGGVNERSQLFGFGQIG